MLLVLAKESNCHQQRCRKLQNPVVNKTVEKELRSIQGKEEKNKNKKKVKKKIQDFIWMKSLKSKAIDAKSSFAKDEL